MKKIITILTLLLCIGGCAAAMETDTDNKNIAVKDTYVTQEPMTSESTLIPQTEETKSETVEPEKLVEISSEAVKTEVLTADELNMDVTVLSIPDYSGTDFYVVNNNKPYFIENITNYSGEDFIYTAELDSLGRCGTCAGQFSYASMPTDERGEIGHVKPTGWHTVKYDKSVISDLYLYNRCHLLAFQISGLNDEERNLITGTRQFNLDMLEMENQVADLLRYNPDMKVMYRVTPLFEENDLVAKGVLMECYSMDQGESLQFCIFIYNVQDGIVIDYATGESVLDPAQEEKQIVVVTEEPEPTKQPQTESVNGNYIGNRNNQKLHRATCRTLPAEKNRVYFDTKEQAAEAGYTDGCGNCKP